MDNQDNTTAQTSPAVFGDDVIDLANTGVTANNDFVEDTGLLTEVVVTIEPKAEDIITSEAPASALEMQTAPLDELDTINGLTVLELPEIESNVFIAPDRLATQIVAGTSDKYNRDKLVPGPSLPSHVAEIITEAEVQKLLANQPNVDQDEVIKAVISLAPGQFTAMPQDDPMSKELNAKTASRHREWRQYNKEVPNTQAAFMKMSNKIEPNSSITRPEDAAEFFGRSNNLTRKARIPCQNSGVTVLLQTPDDLALLLTEEQITQNKLEAGYATFGLSFSNSSVYVARAVFDLIKSCVVAHSVEDGSNKIDLGDILSIYDLKPLAAGITAVSYPEGHRFVRTVYSRTGDPTKRRNVVETVAPLRTLITDYSALTESHLEHLRKSRHTAEEVLKYRSTLPSVTTTAFKLSPNTSVTFRVPTINEYLEAGDEWLVGIETALKLSASVSNMNELQRREIFNRRVNQTQLREFSHWVESISDTTGAGVYVKDREAIYRTLDTLSASPEIRDKFMDAIIQFKATSAVQITAIACASDEASPHTTFNGYIEYDPLNVFFTLLGLKRETQVRY